MEQAERDAAIAYEVDRIYHLSPDAQQRELVRLQVLNSLNFASLNSRFDALPCKDKDGCPVATGSRLSRVEKTGIWSAVGTAVAAFVCGLVNMFRP